MRNNGLKGRERVVVLAMALVAGLLAAPAAMAVELPNSCTAGIWTVTLTAPPSVVNPPVGVTCPSGSCISATYQVSGARGSQPDHVVGLMPLALDEVVPGNQIYAPGVGDPVLGLGLGDMSRKAFKVNPNADVSLYTVYLDGQSFGLGLVPVRIKKGSKGTAIEGACALAGPADVGTNPLATFTPDLDEVVGGKCKVHARTDPHTGVTTVSLVPLGSASSCTISDPIPIGQVTIKVGTDDIGPVLFSEGFSFMVGTGTCTYKQYYPTTGNVYKICW